MKTRAFTLTELLTVIVLVAILATISMSAYQKTVEEMQKRQAKSNMHVIRSAEKMYRYDNNSYYAFSDLGNNAAADGARSALRMDVRDDVNWTYSVSVSTGATISATRLIGPKAGSVITMDASTGTITDYSW